MRTHAALQTQYRSLCRTDPKNARLHGIVFLLHCAILLAYHIVSWNSRNMKFIVHETIGPVFPTSRTLWVVRSVLLFVLLQCAGVLHAQPFVSRLPILQDSLPILLEHASPAHGYSPLNLDCLCMIVPKPLEGKVLVELIGASKAGLANFYGYASQGRLYACITKGPIAFHNNSIHYDGRPISHAVIRRTLDQVRRW